MSIWMIGKSLMKQHYLKKKEFYSNLDMEEIADQIIFMEKYFAKIFK